MKKFIYIITAFAAFFAGCNGEEFLDEAKQDINAVPVEITSNETLDDLVRGAYFNIKSPGLFGPIDLLLFQDMQSDIVEFKEYSRANSGKYNAQPVYTRQREVNDLDLVQFPWAGAYTLLFNTNVVIDFLDNNGPIDDQFASWAPRMKGEAYFLRAFAHYLLATSYAPPYSSNPQAPSIILRTKPTNAPTDFKGLSTNEEVYTQIISDLKNAIDLLPEEFDASLHPEDYQDRAKKDAARFLLAKVYFLMGSDYWTSGRDGDGGALEQINAILSTNKYPLYQGEDLGEIFLKKGLNEKVDETVWYLSYYFRNGWRTPRFSVYFSELNNRNRSFAMSKATLNELGWNDSTEAKSDQRYTDWHQRFDEGGPDEDPVFAGQYQDEYNVWNTKFNNNTSNFVVFRSAELYLMRAVIRLNNNDLDGATADINRIRTRAGLESLNTVTADDIDLEWIKEMGFEGRRLFFLQAQQMDIPAGDRAGGPIPYDDISLVRDYPRVEKTRNPNFEE